MKFRARFALAAAKHASRATEFICFDPVLLSDRNVAAADAQFLSEIGLPKDEPFFGFNALTAESMDERLCFLGDPPNLYLLGEPGASHLIALNTETGRVVCVRYENEGVVFVSSSLHLFAEALCLFHELDDARDFVGQLEKVDPPAAALGAFWRELADDFQALEDL